MTTSTGVARGTAGRWPGWDGTDLERVGKVLVVGADTHAFLAVVRSLGRRGASVHAVRVGERSPAFNSRYLLCEQRLPGAGPHEPRWLDAFEQLLRRQDYELVVPCVDEIVVPLHAHRERFANLPGLQLLSELAFQTAFDKAQTAALARSLGVPTPREVRVSGVQQAPELAAEFGLPVVLKPQSSMVNGQSERRRVRKAGSLDELSAQLASLLPEGPVLAQENFAGVGLGVELLVDRGQVLYAFQHRRVHEPLQGGGSSYRVSEPVNPALLEAARRLLAAMDYSGVAMVEFKLNPQTLAWSLIEINGRFWGSLPLALAAGADFPYYLWQWQVRGRMQFPFPYRTGVYCRALADDLWWQRENLRAGHADPDLLTMPFATVLGELWHVLTGREFNDTLVRDDPLPFFGEAEQIVRTQLRALAGRLGRR